MKQVKNKLEMMFMKHFAPSGLDKDLDQWQGSH